MCIDSAPTALHKSCPWSCSQHSAVLEKVICHGISHSLLHTREAPSALYTYIYIHTFAYAERWCAKAACHLCYSKELPFPTIISKAIRYWYNAQ